MLKNVKYLILSLCTIALFSCATQKNEVYLDEEVEEVEVIEEDENSKSNSVYETYADTTTDAEIQEFDIKSENDATLKSSLKKVVNANTPMYQEKKNNTKRIEKKTILIKPVNDYTRAFHDLSSDEIKTFLDFVEKSEADAMDEGKKYNVEGMKILMENYKNILNISSVCCSSSITENLKDKGFNNRDIKHIFARDAEYLSTQDRCLFIPEEDIETSFENANVADVVLKSKNDCICNNKSFIRNNVNNFYRVYNSDNEFYKKPLIYRYKSKNGNIVEEDVNETILNLAIMLESCP